MPLPKSEEGGNTMPAPNVIYIPSKRETRKLKACVYARVSTLTCPQEESLEEQTRYYENLIKNDPSLEFAGVYADDGISGTQAKTRPALMQMLQDCEDGKIDLIFVKPKLSDFYTCRVRALTASRTSCSVRSRQRRSCFCLFVIA